MTNESVLITETHLPIPMTVANATGILKGTHLNLTDPNTAIQTSGTNDQVAGIAGNEKTASDGNTKIPVYRGGMWKGIASGTIGVGDPLGFAGIGGLNYLYSIKGLDNASGHIVVGTSFEAATDEETFLFELRPQSLVDPRA